MKKHEKTKTSFPNVNLILPLSQESLARGGEEVEPDEERAGTVGGGRLVGFGRFGDLFFFFFLMIFWCYFLGGEVIFGCFWDFGQCTFFCVIVGCFWAIFGVFQILQVNGFAVLVQCLTSPHGLSGWGLLLPIGKASGKQTSIYLRRPL